MSGRAVTPTYLPSSFPPLQGNLKSWLLDPRANDQFSVVLEGGEKVAVYNNCKPDPAPAEARPRWTETYVRWSPLGTFLVTFHQRGIALWGGAVSCSCCCCCC